MDIDLSLLHSKTKEEIDISGTYTIPSNYYENSDIIKLEDVKVEGHIIEKEDENKDLDEFLDRSVKDETVEMAQPEKQNIEIDYLAPLSGGVLLLSCLGGAYLLGKRRKE